MNKKIKTGIMIIVCAIILFIAKDFFNQKFDSVETLQAYMKDFGIAAPLALTLFQAIQVVIPVLPGYLGCAAGAVAFGSMSGFWCNYIGISAGSIIAYHFQMPGLTVSMGMPPASRHWETKFWQLPPLRL